MRHRNNVFTATLVALAFALAPVVQAGPRLDGGPFGLRATLTPRARPTPAPRLSPLTSPCARNNRVTMHERFVLAAQISKPAE
jgi:hypothetical protein